MTATIRLAIAMLVTGLVLGAAPARAQDVPAPPPETTNTTDTVGPRELQNFNLEGTVTRRAEPQQRPPAPSPAAPSARSPATTPATGPARPVADPAPSRRTPAAAAEPEERNVPSRSPPPIADSPSSSSVTARLPPVGDSPTDTAFGGNPALPPGVPAPANDVPLPWLFAAVLLLAGAGAYFWRYRQRAALAGGMDPGAGDAYETFTEPVAKLARPMPRAAPEPDPIGLVSTRLRPWLEIAFSPTRCTIDRDNVTFEFELGLFNSGSMPARAILVEASFFNAGEDQDRALEHFFANPVAAGERAVSLAPLKKMVIANKVVTPRAQVREYEAGGRKLFVPLLGFNALYRWANGEGQTSASFLLGRATAGEKLAPFRLDMVDREFLALGQRPLPQSLRN